MSLDPVCILAGGLGTRLGVLAAGRPKPLVSVAGEPFIFHQLRLLGEHRARRVIICVGYRGEQIESAVGDGRELGLEISYAYDGPQAAGTAGAVRGALPLLGRAFFVLYGDTYLRVDYQAVQRAFRASRRPALMTVLRNDNRWDASNARFVPDGEGPSGQVTEYGKGEVNPHHQWIDYGLGMFTAEGFLDASTDTTDLAAVYRRLAERGELAGFEANERFYEIGTAKSLAETDAFLRREASRRAKLPT